MLAGCPPAGRSDARTRASTCRSEPLDALPAHYREVIALSRIARLPRALVALRMQRTEASVRNLLTRALVALAEALDERHRRDGVPERAHAR